MSARKILTPEQKVGILREHLLEKVPVSQVCDKHGVSVVNFYNWRKQIYRPTEGRSFSAARFI
ncbi:MAG TPA: transposase [Planctomycetaceae bacterium]|nr:transposase [Planctomycetaceae bacterium]